jgi:oleandomycin transport system ATP-binding protein
MRMAITARGITKRYGQTAALRGVDLDVPAGTILGLLGPNGAGKTTMVRILATLERPDNGHALVDGFDVVRQARQVRPRIGLTGQFCAVDEDISGRENLYMVARLLGRRPRAAKARAGELLEEFGLTSVAGKSSRKYSGGMRRRLDLAMSLVGDPSVVYLDEPTTGLDPHSRNDFWDRIRSLAGRGVTILLTTQYMEEAEALADTVTVLRDGRIIASGPPAELRARVGGQVLHIRPACPADRVAVVAALVAAGLEPTNRPAVATAAADTALATTALATTELANTELASTQDDAVVRLPIIEEQQLTRALRVLAGCGVAIAAIDTRVPSLDEVFLTLTGPALDDRELNWDKEPA